MVIIFVKAKISLFIKSILRSTKYNGNGIEITEQNSGFKYTKVFIRYMPFHFKERNVFQQTLGLRRHFHICFIGIISSLEMPITRCNKAMHVKQYI